MGDGDVGVGGEALGLWQALADGDGVDELNFGRSGKSLSVVAPHGDRQFGYRL